jgi:hypothetical protein
MSYVIQQVVSSAFLTNVDVHIDNQNPDNSAITLRYGNFNASGVLLEEIERDITGKEAVSIVPSLYLALTNIANKYNPYDPNSAVPLSEQ